MRLKIPCASSALIPAASANIKVKGLYFAVARRVWARLMMSRGEWLLPSTNSEKALTSESAEERRSVGL